MSEVKYGIEPIVVGNMPIKDDEMHFILYMPVVIPERPIKLENMIIRSPIVEEIQRRLPQHLEVLGNMIVTAMIYEKLNMHNDFPYWYITSKNIHVTPDNMANRPGWHSDGYGTTDVNYIWMNQTPTEFAIQKFTDLSSDHSVSLKQFDEQVHHKNIKQYGVDNLIRIDEQHIHRVPLSDYAGMRHFIKISGSHHKFNLAGNAHNDRLYYNWKMYSRDELRNMESVEDNSDYVDDNE